MSAKRPPGQQKRFPGGLLSEYGLDREKGAEYPLLAGWLAGWLAGKSIPECHSLSTPFYDNFEKYDTLVAVRILTYGILPKQAVFCPLYNHIV